MKTLSERLEDYKVLKREIEKGETKSGYEVKYGSKLVSFTFKELNNHRVIERKRRNY